MESDGKLRLLRLLEILQTESDEQRPISIAEITEVMKERWGIDAYRITVQKDIEALRLAGYEIETIRTTQNRYYLTSRLFFCVINFDDSTASSRSFNSGSSKGRDVR